MNVPPGSGRSGAGLGRKLVLALASTLIALGGVELVLRLTTDEVNRVNFTAVPGSMFKRPTFPGADHMLRRNAEGVQEFGSDPRGYFDPGATLTYHTNNLGLRGPDTTQHKPAGRFRILGLGDSYTFGTGVREQDTFLRRLQRDLDREQPGAYEVLNLGVPAWQTANEVAFLEHKGLALEPDLVVICLFLNDLVVGAGNLFLDITEQQELPWLRRHLRSVDLVMTTLERRRIARREVARYHESVQEDRPRWRETQAALRHAHALAGEHGFRLVLMIFPVLFELGDYPFADVHQAIASAAEKIGIPVLDLRAAFATHDGPELWVHPSNEHPNEVGHAIAAQALHAYLRDQGFLIPR